MRGDAIKGTAKECGWEIARWDGNSDVGNRNLRLRLDCFGVGSGEGFSDYPNFV